MLLRQALRYAVLALSLSSGLLSEAVRAEETPSKKALVNFQDSTEVVQVLWLASSSELEVAALMQARGSEGDFQDFAAELAKGYAGLRDRLEALAEAQGIGLSPLAFTATARLVEMNVKRDVEILRQKPADEFRNATLDILIYQFQRMISICGQVAALNSDPDLKAATAAFQDATEALLTRARALRTA